MLIDVVVGLVKQEGKLLLCKRPPGKPYAGYWEFPGGKVEPAETRLEALQRELQEELGIIVKTASSWGEYIHHYPDKSVCLNLWVVTDFDGLPSGLEGQDLEWVTFSTLIKKNLLEGNLPLLNQIEGLFIENSPFTNNSDCS
ncbi:MAG: (deoxy)nucleoside triphosphate pyrophosphohydrolase [Gammaproteobacteria bacterium]|nr:(deoxy)nucleoside triphosphate pyrophosphohydrolase [Gammaproteobacteria bacterium]